ncbi:MAG: hypothetical protein WB760_05725, partial [Xanthobacteraceae bacterium]
GDGIGNRRVRWLRLGQAGEAPVLARPQVPGLLLLVLMGSWMTDRVLFVLAGVVALLIIATVFVAF